MKTTITSLLAFFTVLVVCANSAQQQEFLIGADGTAVLRLTNTETSAVAGEVAGSLDLAKGEGVLNGTLQPLNLGDKLTDLSLRAYGHGTQEISEITGKLSLKLVEKVAVKLLNLKVESYADTKEYFFKTLLEMVLTKEADEKEMPEIKVVGDWAGSLSSFKSKMNVDVKLSPSDMEEVPFTFLDTQFYEVEKDGVVVTTLKIAMKVPADGPLAKQLQALPKMKKGFEEKLTAMNLKVVKFDIPEPTVIGGIVASSLELSVKDLEATLGFYLNMGSAFIPKESGMNGVELVKAIKEMIKMRIDNLHVVVESKDGKLVSTVDTSISKLDTFWKGYFTFIQMSLDNIDKSMKEEGIEQKAFWKYYKIYNQVVMKDVEKMIAIMVETGSSATAKFGFGLDPKPETAKVSFNIDLRSTDVEKAMAKFASAGLPVGKMSAFWLDAKMTPEGVVTSDLFAKYEGDVISYYKSIAVRVLEQVGNQKEVVEMVKGFALKKGVFSVEVEKDKGTLAYHLQTTPLDKIVAGITAAMLPDVKGKPIAVSVQWSASATDKQGKGVASVYFKDVKAQDKEGFRSALNLGEECVLVENATPVQLAFAPVPPRSVGQDGSLVILAKKAQSELDAGRTTGGPSTILIGAMVIFLVVIVIFSLQRKA